MDTLPSVEAIISLLPEEDFPKFFEISTVIVSMLPVNFISQFFISLHSRFLVNEFATTCPSIPNIEHAHPFPQRAK
jgi:hypothetical protein